MCSKLLKNKKKRKKAFCENIEEIKMIKKIKNKFIIQINKRRNTSNNIKQLKSQTHCHICKKLISRKNYSKHTYKQHFLPNKDNLENFNNDYKNNSKISEYKNEFSKIIANDTLIKDIESNHNKTEISKNTNNINSNINEQNLGNSLIMKFQQFLPETNNIEKRINNNEEIVRNNIKFD